MTTAKDALLRVENLCRVFATDELDTHALRNINFELRKGEYLSISGPSGSGKSTLLAIIGLLDTATSGHLILSGVDVTDIDVVERARIRNEEIGFIFQSFNLIDELTVEQNVELPLTIRSNMSKSEREHRVDEVLERVGMLHRKKHYPAQLSGGQQQRVAVARALVGKPNLLLADEPTGNLDSTNGHAVMTLLDELNADGTTICMVTHDPRYSGAAQRNLHVFDGEVVDEEVMKELKEQEERRILESAQNKGRQSISSEIE